MTKGIFAFATILSVATFNAPAFSEKLTEKSQNVYHGRYTRDIDQGELLVPRRVLEDGSFHSYYLPNYYDRRELANERKKRSPSDPLPDKLHLLLPFNGIDHHVELHPYHDFISPEMVIETRGSGISTNLNEAVRFRRAADQQCHYRGFVRGQDNSRAVLSLCDGVAGYVQTNHGRYFIEPLNEIEPEPDGQHVHIAYKRDAPHEKGPLGNSTKRTCGTKDDWESAWGEQLMKLQQRQKDNHKRAPVASYSIHRYIEIGLVADRRFLDYHNSTDYEQYLLTIMNMVSDFYHDSSCGNQIDVVVVRMIYLEKEKEEIDLLISPAAENTLDSFAAWAQKMNPKDHNHPNHFDIAVLVTRYDICSEGTNCDLMGLAFVASACDPAKAACINEDGGLLLGIVIAHEVGHVMGCSHDQVDISGCPPKDTTDDSFFIMSPIVFLYTIRWSTCSRRFITNFLDSGLGDCLNDEPRSPPKKFAYPNMLPGAMYDADFQCQLLFPGTKACTGSLSADCNTLWCLSNSSCVSKGTPKADGTKCGENKWCIHRKCVDKGARPAAVNGGWGTWGPMSSCSRSCGGGVKYSERECNKPTPANGGRYCIGERKRFATCNTMPCDPKKPSYRALQCSEHDNEELLSDGLHKWKPYVEGYLEPCALYCYNEKGSFMKILPSVNDSTPCKPGTNNMCIAGVCKKVGCDWVLDSNAVEDKCGICKGDGTKCKIIEGDYTELYPRQAFRKVVTIPKGARSVFIGEKKPSGNIFVLKLAKNTSVVCLNPGNQEQRSGDYDCVGMTIIYAHPEREKEQIFIKGPLTEDIQVEYAFYTANDNPGVHYEYSVSSSNPGYTPKYVWDFVDWSECNARCNGGSMISEATCVEEHGGRVSPSFCDGIPRPDPKSRICNQQPCPAKWRVSQWSKCSACDGNKGTRHRKIQCVRSSGRPGEDDVQANFDACKGRVPRQKEECVGTRPCRKECAKRTRNSDEEDLTQREEKERRNNVLSEEDERRMIDEFVDLELARYLEKVRGKSLRNEKRSENREFREFLRDWVATSGAHELEKKQKRTCDNQTKFTTLKPGSIIKDSIPVDTVILKEAPYTEGLLKSNLSDKAFREMGDIVGMGIDTSKEKIYRGEEAVKMIEQISQVNSTSTASPKTTESSNATTVERSS